MYSTDERIATALESIAQSLKTHEKYLEHENVERKKAKEEYKTTMENSQKDSAKAQDNSMKMVQQLLSSFLPKKGG